MARQINRLSARTVASAKKLGRRADGGGLYLQVGRSGTKSWIFRFMLNGRPREMGLGPVYTVPLQEARTAAQKCRKLLLEGLDPIEARKARRHQRKVEASSSITFEECAEAYIRAHEAGWKNAKHVAQWRSTLSTYAFPVFGSLPVQAIDTALVCKTLEPIWRSKTETASRLRGRIEAVLDWAAARDYRDGDNPARWKGHLDKLLPARSKVQKVRHHPALPYDEMGSFMAKLREHEGVSALGLELLILTAVRTGEVVGATWDEVNFEKRVWIIPADRTKAEREHRVPLSQDAMAVLDRLREASQSEYVLPGANNERPLSTMAFLQLLKRMGRGDLTVHGFRSTFRDWAAEQTNFAREVAEMALAHAVGDKVEAAYRRGDLFEKRGKLMEAWARYSREDRRPASGTSVTALHGRA